MTIVHSVSLLPNREIHKETIVSVMKNAKNEHLGTGYSKGILLKVALSGSFSKVGQSTFNQRPYRRRYAQKIKANVLIMWFAKWVPLKTWNPIP